MILGIKLKKRSGKDIEPEVCQKQQRMGGEIWRIYLVTKATDICGKTSGKPREEKDTWW